MLNPAQLQAVRMPGHCLVTACPGSGKTKLLEHRAAFLLEPPANKVLAVTFTSESAQELEHRIRQQAPNARNRLMTGTFHALAKKQLQNARKRVQLINAMRQNDLLRRAYRDTIDADAGISFEDARAFVEAMKATVDPHLPDRRSNPKFDMFLRYEELLEQTGSSDFADLLLKAVRGMRDGTVAPFRTPFMLVDEFQDTDKVQLAWIAEHVNLLGTKVTVVGDDDQSIYEWRHAMGFVGFEDFRRLTDAPHVSLDTTYRCAREIMEPASLLIAHNEERVVKSLTTANTTRGSTAVKPCADKEEEWLAIATAIASSGSPGDWAVLARTNAQLEALEQYIAGRVPTIRSGGTKFWELRGPSVYLAICGGLTTGNMADLDQVLVRAGVGESQLEALHEECQSRQPGAVHRFIHGAKKGSTKEPIERLRILMRQWSGMIAGTEINLALHGIANYIKTNIKLYDKERRADEVAKDESRLDSCAAALSRLRGPLIQRVRAVLQEEREEGGAARLLTFHSSKGLEFPNVWIMGCEEGVIPSTNSPIEEERRLFYVGMTRAKLNLTISYVVDEKAPPTRFISEAGLK
ncbi:ATP-dependent helicase (plasmid) [Dyella sp. BiH032]|uniref:ATP-dependent helicase n=1 Tax=Dyella sp. BiH032 TaxID=3075430 RepID=UPI0028930E10|nr:ATP-dependent helicase [Dyella sp. BiH032]WNL48523.1 ATP-dependent helicase [Dyella sp. BiH032]